MSTIPPAPEWLGGLIRGIAREGVKPRDPRVQQLWNLLRGRGLLARSEWVRTRLRYVWGKGLVTRARPRTTRQLQALLRSWGILPPSAVPTIPGVVIPQGYRPLRRLRPVRVHRVGRVRPLARPRGRR
jgi:hypothetical protein